MCTCYRYIYSVLYVCIFISPHVWQHVFGQTSNHERIQKLAGHLPQFGTKTWIINSPRLFLVVQLSIFSGQGRLMTIILPKTPKYVVSLIQNS